MSKGTTPIGTHSSLNIINKTPQKKYTIIKIPQTIQKMI